jgi:hypothetical protein
MNAMKRRTFVEKVGLGSAALVAGAMGARAVTASQGRGGPHVHNVVDGPLASATVSFGQWPATGVAPLDRTVTPNAPVAPNIHELIPNTATIKAGGSVNYVIAGFHQILVYAPGTGPDTINTTIDPIPIPGAPPPVFLINDPLNRIYRGLSPIDQPQDRVEVVHFGVPGLYFVMCGVSVHFFDDMYGWVRVLP